MTLTTTKRYPANGACEYNCYNIQEGDEYQFGCELEFYICPEHDFQSTIAEITAAIQAFSDVDILVDMTYLPSDPDKDHCIQIKPDSSLQSRGIEISIPITSLKGVKHYLEKILPLIYAYGYTNEETGLHFHISTIKNDGVNINFYVYMLMCHNKQLLTSWEPRPGYSHNVMDVLLKHRKSEARVIKTKKGTIWNLEKITANHIEIKTMGGLDYHKKIDQILTELELYAECFDIVKNNKNLEYRKKLIHEHEQEVLNAPEPVQLEFSKAVAEAGLIE